MRSNGGKYSYILFLVHEMRKEGGEGGIKSSVIGNYGMKWLLSLYYILTTHFCAKEEQICNLVLIIHEQIHHRL